MKPTPKQLRTALRVTLRITAKWRLSVAETAALLSVKKRLIRQIRAGKPIAHALLSDPEFQEKLSLLLHLHSSLRTCFSDETAYSWLTLRNHGEPFCGASPLSYILAGGSASNEAIRKTLATLDQNDPL